MEVTAYNSVHATFVEHRLVPEGEVCLTCGVLAIMGSLVRKGSTKEFDWQERSSCLDESLKEVAQKLKRK